MHSFSNALWVELLKVRRSKAPLLISAGFLILPLIVGLFMIILKNPEQARSMGLISMKAQLSAGTADWPTLWSMLEQGVAIGGGVLFAMMTAWIFGREFSDHTLKELLALPTSRGNIVAAKFVVLACWILVLVLVVFMAGLGIGAAITIPGWSAELLWTSFWIVLMIAVLNFMLMPFVALVASTGRGYLPPMGWVFFTVVLAQIAVIVGWGDWLPWSVPALLSGMAGPHSQQLGLHSYLGLCIAFTIGIACTWLWWRDADHAR